MTERGAIGVAVGATALAVLAGCGSSSSRETGPPCRTGDYRVALATNGATGGIVGIVGIRTVADSPCQLETQLRFAAEHADGVPVRQVEGNPAALRISTRLRPSTVFVRDWTWRNWCGAAERFRFSARAGPEGAAVRGISPPRCDDPHSPSRLMRFQGA